MKDNFFIHFLIKVLMPVFFCFIVLYLNLEFFSKDSIYSNSSLLYISIMNFTILSISFLEEIRYVRRIMKIDQSNFSNLDKDGIIDLIANNKLYYIFQTFLLLLLSMFVLYLIEGDSVLVS